MLVCRTFGTCGTFRTFGIDSPRIISIFGRVSRRFQGGINVNAQLVIGKTVLDEASLTYHGGAHGKFSELAALLRQRGAMTKHEVMSQPGYRQGARSFGEIKDYVSTFGELATLGTHTAALTSALDRVAVPYADTMSNRMHDLSLVWKTENRKF